MAEAGERHGYVTILHISDLHFGAEDLDRRKALQEDTVSLKPDIICVTGDVTNWPRKKHFESAREFLQVLSNITTPAGERTRLYIVPGNHDAFLGLRKYRKYLIRPLLSQDDVAFADFVRIRDQPVCIFGLNSTWFSKIPNLQNKGRVTERRLKEFNDRIDQLTQSYGDEYSRARKMVLVHHHPIPTVARKSSEQQFENMLFLQNSGRFLTEMARMDISLILHGHQHQPCDFLLDYNVGNGATMVVLSAGTTLKHIDEIEYHRAQYYVLNLYKDRLYIESRNYHGTQKRFIPTKSGMRDLKMEPWAECKVSRTYDVLGSEALKEIGETFVRATAGQTISTFKIGFGVDESTAPAASKDCGLEVFRNGTKLGADSLRMLRDEPREKQVEVILNPPLSQTIGETLSWTYEWPGGWSRLLKDRRDTGSYFVDRKLDKLTIRVRSQVPQVAALVKPVVPSEWTVATVADGFEVVGPPLSHQIMYDVRLSTKN